MIGRMMHGMPTRPAFVLAVIIIAGTVAAYYFSRYQECTHHASLRGQLYLHIKTKLGETVSLAEAIPFNWEELSILTNYQPLTKLPECPFGWDWSRQHRLRLISRGELNMLVFNREGEIYPEYIDIHRNQISFQGVSGSYTPETAKFSVAQQAGSRGGVLLTPVVP